MNILGLISQLIGIQTLRLTLVSGQTINIFGAIFGMILWELERVESLT